MKVHILAELAGGRAVTLCRVPGIATAMTPTLFTKANGLKFRAVPVERATEATCKLCTHVLCRHSAGTK